MSEKFDMKVVIDSVTTPLLHERLSAARSYRERAAILRSLAESALRGVPTASGLPAASPGVTGNAHPEAAARFTGATEEGMEPVAPLLMRAPEQLADSADDGHDVAALADQFASFLHADA
jgi:hypothetical protein